MVDALEGAYHPFALAVLRGGEKRPQDGDDGRAEAENDVCPRLPGKAFLGLVAGLLAKLGDEVPGHRHCLVGSLRAGLRDVLDLPVGIQTLPPKSNYQVQAGIPL